MPQICPDPGWDLDWDMPGACLGLRFRSMCIRCKYLNLALIPNTTNTANLRNILGDVMCIRCKLIWIIILKSDHSTSNEYSLVSNQGGKGPFKLTHVLIF